MTICHAALFSFDDKKLSFGYNRLMLTDSYENISAYYDILPSLKAISSFPVSLQEDMKNFEKDRKKSTLFYVEEGECTCATTWREVSGGSDVTAAIKLKKGDFVLFFPSEQFLVKGLGKILKYTLE
ncbi:MAG: hypothetical protein IJ836_04670 [Spirochaetales bacterium]|nr:hypothetical protein [Spirochaetales bacterium]